MSFLGSLRSLIGQKEGVGGDTTPATSSVPIVEPASVEELIDRHLEARGGRERISALQTVRLTGRVTGGELKNVPVTVLKKRPGRYLRKLEDRRGITLQVVDGDIAWEVGEAIEVPSPAAMDRIAARRFRRLADFDGPWIDAAAKGHRLELAGRETVDGVETFKVKASFKNTERPGFYSFDARSFLLLKSLEMAPAPEGGIVPTETFFQEMRESGGILWPMTEVVSIPRLDLKQTFVWETIELDVPIEDEVFQFPSR